MRHLFLVLLLVLLGTVYADVTNPVFWERAVLMNVTTGSNTGLLVQSTSYIVVSQDFQGIYSDSASIKPPDGRVINFGESCPSSNTTIDTIRQNNFNATDQTSIKSAQKTALVKRGNCTWSEKLSVVNNIAMANSINITSIFIYDNNTHQVDITRTSVSGSGSVSPASYSTPLPANRSVLNMTDNDLDMNAPFTTTVYFIPNTYGTALVDRINRSYNASNPDMRTYWLLTPYIDEVSWGYGGDNFFSTGKGYLSYIIALAGVFLIGVIFLRWWKIRRMRAEYPNGFNGFQNGNGFPMQPRINHLDPLPVDIVNALPIDKYSPDLIKNTNCAICLEDFVPGKSDIRLLPCGHGFCVLCIDPWLTQKSTMCPICKWDCLPADLRRERDLQQENATTIDMNAAGPSTTSSEIEHVENINRATAPNTAHNGSIIPPPILPAASPPPSPRLSEQKHKPVLQENPFDSSNNLLDEKHADDRTLFDGNTSVISNGFSAESSSSTPLPLHSNEDTDNDDQDKKAQSNTAKKD